MRGIDAISGRRLAAQLRLWRKRAMLTQEQLARTTGLGVRTIRRLESRADLRPRSASIKLLAAALNLSEEEQAQLASAGEPPQVPLVPVPRQLPRDLAGFLGRDQELATLAGCSPGVVVISGMVGVGKTSLALHWAHRVAATFPDGNLYVDLRGFDPESAPLDPATVLPAFLIALGVPRQQIPLEAGAQASLYRTTMAGKQILIVLDNAFSAQQVRPLLPADASATVVVTSRNQLAGLAVTDNARFVRLDPLPTQHAQRLLADRLGQHRVASEPNAAKDIATLCAGLPLALAVAAARVLAEPSLTLGALASRLRDAGQRLNALELDDDATDVRAVFHWSYRSLDPAGARMFRLLGVHPRAEITVPAAASAAGLSERAAQTLLRELVSAHLIDEPAPGRYVLHDLLHLFAREQAEQAEQAGQAGQAGQEEARQAAARLADYFVNTALAADRVLYPLRQPIETREVGPIFAGPVEASGWLLSEHRTLLAMVQRLSAGGEHRQAWTLAWALSTFLERQGFWPECLLVRRLSLGSAESLGDAGMLARSGQALARAYLRQRDPVTALKLLLEAQKQAERCGEWAVLAGVHLELSRLHHRRQDMTRAASHARTALDLYEKAGDVAGQATTLNAIGWHRLLSGQFEAALSHCRQAMELFGRLDDESSLYAGTLHSIGYACHRLGRHDEAHSHYQRALELARARGDRSLAATILTFRGEVFQDVGEVDQAREAWHEALTLLEGFDPAGADEIRARLIKAG